MKSIFCLFCLATSIAHAQLLITEVFVSKKSWFEVLNIGEKPVDLAGAEVRVEDVVIKLSSKVVLPDQYALIANQIDLGIGVCLDVPMSIASFNFKSSGVKTLCIRTVDGNEDCVKFENSGYNWAANLSGNDEVTNWKVEDCEIAPGIFASPGSAGGFCHQRGTELRHRIACPARGAGSAPRFSHLTWRADSTVLYGVQDDDADEAFELSFYAGQTPILESAPIDDKGHGEVKLDLSALTTGDYDIIAVLRDFYGNEARQVVKEHVTHQSAPLAAFEYANVTVSASRLLFHWKINSQEPGNISMLWFEPGSQESNYIAAGIFSESSKDQTWVLATTAPVPTGTSVQLLFDGASGRAESPRIPVYAPYCELVN